MTIIRSGSWPTDNGGRGVLMKMALSLLLGMVSAGALSWVSYVRTAVTREELQAQTSQLREGQDKLTEAVVELKVEVGRLREHLTLNEQNGRRKGKENH